MEQDERKRVGRQRLHREDPERVEPIRNWSTLYRQSDSWGSRGSATNSQSADHTTPPDRAWTDVVSHGVELGYNVVEEHIRQGQRVAQQVNDRSYSLGAAGSDIRELVERMARYYADLGSLWGDLINSLAANPDFLNNLFRMLRSQPASANGASTEGTSTNGVSTREAIAVAVEVVSTRPTQVTLDLRPHSERLSLTTYGLRATDPEKPLLTDITFAPSSDNGYVCLRICVPDGQPPDVYTGVIVDKATNLPRGTLSVRIPV
jgi:hypothetical protein